MKSKILTAGLIAAMMVPAMAQAQTRELARDRQDIRQEQRDLNHAKRYGDRHDVRDAHRDVRDAKREYREDKRDNRYQNWRAPFSYHRFAVGNSLRSTYYAPTYRLNYDVRWGVPKAGRNLAYVRHYNDLLLVNVRTGKVVRVYYNHFRWR